MKSTGLIAATPASGLYTLPVHAVSLNITLASNVAPAPESNVAPVPESRTAPVPESVVVPPPHAMVATPATEGSVIDRIRRANAGRDCMQGFQQDLRRSEAAALSLGCCGDDP